MIVGTVELNLIELLDEKGLSESDLAGVPGIEAKGASKIFDGRVSTIRISLA